MGSNTKRQKLVWLGDGDGIGHAAVVRDGVASAKLVCGPTSAGLNLAGKLGQHFEKCSACAISISHNVLVQWVPPAKRK